MLTLQMHAGTKKLLHGLRHFVRWRHPRILVTEFDPGGMNAVFEVRHVHLSVPNMLSSAQPPEEEIVSVQDAHIRMSVLSIEPGEWQAPDWLLGSHAAQPAAPQEAATMSSSSSSDDSSSADAEEAHADAYSEPSSGSDSEQRGAKSGALVPAAVPQPKGLPPVALQPPLGQEPDEASSLGFPVQPKEPGTEQEQSAGDAAQEQAEREERRKAAALRRLDSILGGKANVSKARQKLLQARFLVFYDSPVLLWHACMGMQRARDVPLPGSWTNERLLCLIRSWHCIGPRWMLQRLLPQRKRRLRRRKARRSCRGCSCRNRNRHRRSSSSGACRHPQKGCAAAALVPSRMAMAAVLGLTSRSWRAAPILCLSGASRRATQVIMCRSCFLACTLSPAEGRESDLLLRSRCMTGLGPILCLTRGPACVA